MVLGPSDPPFSSPLLRSVCVRMPAFPTGGKPVFSDTPSTGWIGSLAQDFPKRSHFHTHQNQGQITQPILGPTKIFPLPSQVTTDPRKPGLTAWPPPGRDKTTDAPAPGSLQRRTPLDGPEGGRAGERAADSPGGEGGGRKAAEPRGPGVVGRSRGWSAAALGTRGTGGLQGAPL